MSESSTVVKFVRTNPHAKMPSFAHDGDSGFDLYTVGRYILAANERRVLKVGLRVELPPRHEMQIRPRSGISLKTDLTVLLGTVDSGYRGEIGVIVHNTSKGEYVIEEGERIAQGVVVKLPEIVLEEVEKCQLSETSRGTGGFGSTGVKLRTCANCLHKKSCVTHTAIDAAKDCVQYKER